MSAMPGHGVALGAAGDTSADADDIVGEDSALIKAPEQAAVAAAGLGLGGPMGHPIWGELGTDVPGVEVDVPGAKAFFGHPAATGFGKEGPGATAGIAGVALGLATDGHPVNDAEGPDNCGATTAVPGESSTIEGAVCSMPVTAASGEVSSTGATGTSSSFVTPALAASKASFADDCSFNSLEFCLRSGEMAAVSMGAKRSDPNAAASGVAADGTTMGPVILVASVATTAEVASGSCWSGAGFGAGAGASIGEGVGAGAGVSAGAVTTLFRPANASSTSAGRRWARRRTMSTSECRGRALSAARMASSNWPGQGSALPASGSCTAGPIAAGPLMPLRAEPGLTTWSFLGGGSNNGPTPHSAATKFPPSPSACNAVPWLLLRELSPPWLLLRGITPTPAATTCSTDAASAGIAAVASALLAP
mmetsp:Transcript_85471/g.183210  ORF Transcript_85471/g.183210 Transcript_85471/m.183210 type:complete len:421 (+) Transcript_85471:390-1652(+)